MKMKVNESKITVNGVEFVVKEPTIGAMMPLLPRLSGEDDEDIQMAQMDLLKMCVYVDGKVLGEAIESVGVSTYLTLAEEVMELTGLAAAVEEGKD